VAWEVGGGRATRQPGQIRKEAALTSQARVTVPASQPNFEDKPSVKGLMRNVWMI